MVYVSKIVNDMEFVLGGCMSFKSAKKMARKRAGKPLKWQKVEDHRQEAMLDKVLYIVEEKGEWIQ